MGIHTGGLMAKRHRKLDSLNPGSVVLDEQGHAWGSQTVPTGIAPMETAA